MISDKLRHHLPNHVCRYRIPRYSQSNGKGPPLNESDLPAPQFELVPSVRNKPFMLGSRSYNITLIMLNYLPV